MWKDWELRPLPKTTRKIQGFLFSIYNKVRRTKERHSIEVALLKSQTKGHIVLLVLCVQTHLVEQNRVAAQTECCTELTEQTLAHTFPSHHTPSVRKAMLKDRGDL